MKKVVKTGTARVSEAVITSVYNGIEIDFYFCGDHLGGLRFLDREVDELVQKIMQMKMVEE